MIGASGELEFVHSDEAYELLSPLFPGLRTERAAHVEPDGAGGWVVDISLLWNRVHPEDKKERHVIGTYPRREQALAEERKWVEALLRGEA